MLDLPLMGATVHEARLERARMLATNGPSGM